MTDSQWPRFEVFLQEKPGQPHQSVGSVHAPDPELALFNARDVFVRRPECESLWVAPADQIYKKTSQELQGEPPSPTPPTASGQPETFYVFSKTRPAGTQALVGSVEADSLENALTLALAEFSDEQPVFVWWILPARMVYRSNPLDKSMLFQPALNKPFRLSLDFPTVTMMRQIMSGENVASPISPSTSPADHQPPSHRR